MSIPNTDDVRTRTVWSGLERSPLDPDGLRARLQQVADRYAAGARFAPLVRLDGPLEAVPVDVVADLERVLEEALTNIARHARARSAEVTVRSSGGSLALDIVDDGIGCAGAPTNGGLADLRRRAAWHGGALTLGPGRSGGTRLTWTVPLHPPNGLA